MADIIIVVEGGNVQSVLSSNPDLKVFVRDFDVDTNERQDLKEIDGELCNEYQIKCLPIKKV